MPLLAFWFHLHSARWQADVRHIRWHSIGGRHAVTRGRTARVGKLKTLMKGALAIFLLGALQANALADSGPISTDRPGFSTGTYTVKPGRMNVEFGYQYALNTHGVDQSTQTIPQLDLRLGFSEKSELDLLWVGWNINDTNGQSSDSSVADVSIGGKYRLRRGEEYNLTLLGLLSLPVGSSPSSSDNIDPLLGLLWDYSLADQISLFGVVQSSSFKFEGARAYDAQLAIGASFTLSTKLKTFIEMYGIWPSEAQIDDEVVIDAGFTYLLGNDLQVDINVGLGLNSDSDSFAGLGIAARY